MKSIKNIFISLKTKQVHINFQIFFITSILLFSFFLAKTNAQVEFEEIEGFPIPNGSVNGMLQDGDTLYVGGPFTHWGTFGGYGVVVDPIEGQYKPITPKVYGGNRATIYCSIPDGEGGVFIGGDFTKVGDATRNGLAHIKSDGTLDDWDPNPTYMDYTGQRLPGIIYALTLYRDIIYIGGIFDNIGAEQRIFAAAVNIITGEVTNWNPNPYDGWITAIAVSDSIVYIGGNFTRLKPPNGGEFNRGYLAATNPETGFPTDWNPFLGEISSQESPVLGLLLTDNDSTLYVWGNLNYPYWGACALKTYTNIDMPYKWNPKAITASFISQGQPACIYDLKLVGDTVYLGGTFRYLKSKTSANERKFLGAITKAKPDGSTGTLLPLKADITGPHEQLDSYYVSTGIRSLLITDDKIYFAGRFDTVNNSERNNIASINKNGELDNNWNPNIGLDIDYLNFIYSLTTFGNSDIFVAGKLKGINGKTRFSFASIDIENKEITDWNPDAYYIYNNKKEPTFDATFALYKSKIILGGNFSYIGGLNRYGLAMVNKSTGFAEEINFNAGGTVAKIAVYEDQNLALIKGYFNDFGGKERNRFAQVNLIDGTTTDFYPEFTIEDFFPTKDSLTFLYVYNIDGQNHSGIRVMNHKRWEILLWQHKFENPSYTNIGFNATLIDSILYVGGAFDKIDNFPIEFFAGINMNKDSVFAIHNFDGQFSSLLSSQDKLVTNDTLLFYFGWFNEVNGISKPGVVLLDVKDNYNILNYNEDFNPRNNVLFDGNRNYIFVDNVNEKSPYFGVYQYNYNSPYVSFAPESVSFDSVNIGESKELTYTITNYLRNEFICDSIIVTDNAFVLSTGTINLQVGETFEDTIIFTPTEEKNYEGKIIFYSNSPFSPDTIYVNGVGRMPVDVNDENNLPKEYSLSQNYPNPFNPTTKIKYTIPKTNFVKIKIYDVLGNEITTLVNEEKSAGNYEIEFSGKGLSSGIYFYKIEAGEFISFKKMILLK